jgi:acetyl-CoA carboxylase biotin carboxyl carrier protein
MTVDEIRELIQLASETGVAELEVQRGENRVRIRRAAFGTPQEIVVNPPAYAAAPLPAAASAIGASPVHSALPPAGAAKPKGEKPPEANVSLVKSPIVGTFYECPSPGAPAFVNVGDRVQPGKVLCIIESMKLMNEIEAETSGIVESRLVLNGQPVEYGEALFAIRAI